MDDSLKTLAVNIGSVLLLLGFFGSAFMYLKGSAYKGTIEALTQNVNALKDRVDIQDQEILDLKERRQEDRQRIQALESENSVLLSQRPSNVILEGIVNMVRTNHEEILSMMKEMVN